MLLLLDFKLTSIEVFSILYLQLILTNRQVWQYDDCALCTIHTRVNHYTRGIHHCYLKGGT